jgi:outer membrane protein OmpA-like peptidoglycan-associated protein
VRAWSLSASLLLAATLLAHPARAEGEFELHGGVGGAHALVDPQQRELGFGVTGLASAGWMFGGVAGLQIEGAALYLPRVNPPSDPALAAGSDGSAFTAMVGPVLRPFGKTSPGGLWLDLDGGLVETGGLSRVGLDAHVGYDWRLKGGGRVDLGPFLGYLQVFQPADNIRPEDAHVLTLGVRVGLGPTTRSDRDADGVYDDEDACPDVPGIRTDDPRTNGCPPRSDRDHDGVFDDEDACPDVPGIRTNDPKTNGCPRSDRDHDSVYDDEDACPDVPGIRTNDPKTNGCPRSDRDRDTVFDDEDACPDVPGVRTNDPKTNGCPPAQESVHVEKNQILLDDKIYFETDVARVRHISWPLVQKLAKFLNDNTDIVEVSIEGHADEVGGAEFNMILSEERAKAVLNLLVHFGVDPKRLTSKGWGETRPVVEGHDEAAHSKNRRVEFIITRVRQVNDIPPSPPPGQAPSPAPSPAGGP